MIADSHTIGQRRAFLRGVLGKSALWLSLAASLALGSHSHAGEPIKITTSPETADLPKDLPADRIRTPSNATISGGESGQGPVLPKPNQPALINNPQLEDLVRRKKNWMMYETPNSVDRDRSMEEMLGVRKYDLDDLQKKSKGELERYYDAAKESKKSRAAKDGLSRDGTNRDAKNGLEPGGRHSLSDDPQTVEPAGIIEELNPAILFNWGPGQEGLGQLNSSLNRNSILPRGLGEAIFGQKGPESAARDSSQSRRDIERLWDAKKAPLGRFGDPINDQADSTRSFLNPIAARKASGPPPESTQTRFGESGAAFGSIAPMAARPDFFNSSRDRSSFGPSYPSPVAAPVSSPVLQPKPAILEIPRPKF